MLIYWAVGWSQKSFFLNMGGFFSYPKTNLSSSWFQIVVRISRVSISPHQVKDCWQSKLGQVVEHKVQIFSSFSAHNEFQHFTHTQAHSGIFCLDPDSLLAAGWHQRLIKIWHHLTPACYVLKRTEPFWLQIVMPSTYVGD